MYLPGVLGDCELLEDHTPLIQVIRPGVVKLQKKEIMTYTFLSGGVVVMYGKALSLFTTHGVFLPDERDETLAQALQHFSYAPPYPPLSSW